MCAAWIHMSSPHRVDYHSGAPTSPLASLGMFLGAEEDLSVPKKAPRFMGARLGHER
jgi:hypothetical protein